MQLFISSHADINLVKGKVVSDDTNPDLDNPSSSDHKIARHTVGRRIAIFCQYTVSNSVVCHLLSSYRSLYDIL